MDEPLGSVQTSADGQVWSETTLHCAAPKAGEGHRACTVKLKTSARFVRLSAPTSGDWGVSDLALRFVGHLD